MSCAHYDLSRLLLLDLENLLMAHHNVNHRQSVVGHVADGLNCRSEEGQVLEPLYVGVPQEDNEQEKCAAQCVS